MKKSYTLNALDSGRNVKEYIFSKEKEAAIMDEILSYFPMLSKS